MIYLLIFITLVFLIINFLLASKDYMHPAVILHGMFLIYELVCLCGREAYAVTFHEGTLVVLGMGFFTITMAHLISYDRKKKKRLLTMELKEIEVPKVYLFILLLMQTVSIVYFCKYLGNLSAAYGLKDASLSESIELYDTLTKFWRETYDKLVVPIPMAYRITNPICGAAEYIVIYIMVNNFVVNRKINLIGMMILGLMCIRIIMNGSRSPMLRIFTFAFLLFYVLSLRNGKIRKGNAGFLLKLLIATIGFIVFMFVVLILMGRTSKFTGVVDHLFVYFGAPVLNLDTFIEAHNVKLLGSLSKGTLLGEQTFKGLYQYMYKLFKIKSFSGIESIDLFTFSSNKREIGNVYTMFYKIIYDFGFLGVVPITFIMAIYYCETYRKIKSEPSAHKIIDFRLFIYAYLFNDVVMSAFSNRFYETVFDAVFLKFLIVAWVLDYFLVENKILGFKRRLSQAGCF